MDPTLSVIIPNFNNEFYLVECLDSVLAQTYKNFEIIIIDDKSTDASLEIIDKYQIHHSAIKVICNTINRGVADSRDQAIRASAGEYIATLDSDDFYCNPDKLAMEMALVLQHLEKFGKDIIAFSDVILVDAQGDKLFLASEERAIQEGLILHELLMRSAMIPRDFIMKKECYLSVGGYDTTLPIYEDWDLKIRLAAKYEYRFSGLIGVGYRRHGKGLSAADDSEHIHYLRKILDKNIGLAPAHARPGIRNRLEQTIIRFANRQQH